MQTRLITLIFLASFCHAHWASAQDTNEVRVGVLAWRGWTGQGEPWEALGSYLSTSLDGRPVRMVPVTLASIGPLIEAGGLEFLATNPGHYLTLSETHPMSVLASRKRRLADGSVTGSFGSTIVVRFGSGLETLDQLAGSSVGAVSPQAFGGFQLVWYEGQAQNFDLFSVDLRFFGFPQDRIVTAVAAGEIDAGIVRGGLIEEMIAEGRLAPDAVRVLNRNVTYEHPEAVSTRLYPEWPFIALPGADETLRDQVALALLQSRDSDLTHFWSAPVSYLGASAVVKAFATREASLSGAATRPLWPWIVGAAVTVLALAAGLHLILRCGARPDGAARVSPETEVPLTRRETQILDLIRKGHSTKEIASTLGISPKTVEFHRSNLLRKFEARSAAHLVAEAQTHGQ